MHECVSEITVRPNVIMTHTLHASLLNTQLLSPSMYMIANKC